jgi:hypothetical protein
VLTVDERPVDREGSLARSTLRNRRKECSIPLLTCRQAR